MGRFARRLKRNLEKKPWLKEMIEYKRKQREMAKVLEERNLKRKGTELDVHALNNAMKLQEKLEKEKEKAEKNHEKS